jgi:hypothetical protein
MRYVAKIHQAQAPVASAGLSPCYRLGVAERLSFSSQPAAVDALVLQVLDLRITHMPRIIGLRPAILTDEGLDRRKRVA